MAFNSINFFLFLPAVYLAFCCAGERSRWCVLLTASLLFYGALGTPYLLAVLALVALTSYGFGKGLARATSERAKSALFWLGIATLVLVLVVMKYLPFLSENLGSLASLLALQTRMPALPTLVAIGVSYYVFQAISYLSDIYLEVEQPEEHFGYFFLYLAFFPKLLQGPIERAGALLPQLKASYQFNYREVRLGLLLFTWGLFKKVVLADRIGFYVDHVYSDVHAFSGVPLLLASYAYYGQIFLDFSGYTDMALGSARLFNISLTQNFNSPYLATSVADFWRRWHISFSRWILDYLFNPLQMKWRNARNWGRAAALMVAFLASGLWHGASWGFVAWGGLHGLYLACSVFYRPYQKKLHKALGMEKTGLLKAWQIFATFNLVSLAWVFFRAKSLSDALYVTRALSLKLAGLPDFLFCSGKRELVVLAGFLALAPLIEKMKQDDFQFLVAKPWLARWSFYYLMALSVLVFGINSNQAFIYVRF